MSGALQAPAAGARATVLRATRLTKQFGGLVAVKDVDFDIPEGSIVSLIGPNGAGKTTFFNVVAGLSDPTSGTVEFRGQRRVAPPERAWLEPFVWVAPARHRRGHLRPGPPRRARRQRVSRCSRSCPCSCSWSCCCPP